MGLCDKRLFLLTLCSLQIITTAERQVFDFLGFMWMPILFNFFNIILVILGFFGAFQYRHRYVISYCVWNALWLTWNIFLACFYLDAAGLDKNSDLLNLGTGSFSWWHVNGPGCKPHFNTTIDQPDFGRPPRPDRVTGCVLAYEVIEVIHSSTQCVLAILAIITGILVCRAFLEEDDSSQSKSKQHRIGQGSPSKTKRKHQQQQQQQHPHPLYSIEYSCSPGGLARGINNRSSRRSVRLHHQHQQQQHQQHQRDNAEDEEDEEEDDDDDDEDELQVEAGEFDAMPGSQQYLHQQRQSQQQQLQQQQAGYGPGGPGGLSPKPMTPRRVKRRSVISRDSAGRRSTSSRRSGSGNRSSTRSQHKNPVNRILEQQQQQQESLYANSPTSPVLGAGAGFGSPLNYDRLSSSMHWDRDSGASASWQLESMLQGGLAASSPNVWSPAALAAAAAAAATSAMHQQQQQQSGKQGPGWLQSAASSSRSLAEQQQQQSLPPAMASALQAQLVAWQQQQREQRERWQGQANPSYQQTSSTSLNADDLDELYGGRPASARSSYSNYHGVRATPQVPARGPAPGHSSFLLSGGPPAYQDTVM